MFGLHSKGGGKYGKHAPVTESSNISALSKISLQVFENVHGSQFRSIPTATAIVQTKQFAHIPSINFLCLLTAPPKLLPQGFELAAEDLERFKTLSKNFSKFEEAMTLFRKRGRKATAADLNSDGDLDEDLA